MRDFLSAGLAALVLAACAAPASGPRVANNPCTDPQYLALKAQPVDSLSAREYEQLQEGNAACAQVTAVLAASAGNGAARRPPPEHLDTDAWTQAMANETGSEIHVRNKSTVPIIVTEVILTSCTNLVEPCGSHYPRVRIEPGDARRVMRLRYGGNNVAAGYQFRYRVEPADRGQN